MTSATPRSPQRRQHWSAALLGVAALAAWWLLLAPTQIGGPLTFAIVHGSSMEPMLADGDLVVAARRSDYQVADVVLYQKYGGAVIHRLTRGDPAIGWTSRGVNNSFDDAWRVMPDDIRGTFVLRSAPLGHAVTWLAGHPVAIALGAVGMFLLLALPLRRRPAEVVRLQRLSTRESDRPRLLLTIACVASIVLPMAGAVVLMLRSRTEGPTWPVAIVAVLTGCLVTALASRPHDPTTATAEPGRTLTALGEVRRLPADVAIMGTPLGVTGRAQFIGLARDSEYPVFHQHAVGSDRDTFTLVTAEGNRIWTVTRPPTPLLGSHGELGHVAER